MEEGGDIQAKINHLKGVIRKTPAELLQERVYVCVANSCILLTAYKRENGAKGWCSNVYNSSGEPLFTSKEQLVIEEGFTKAPWLLDMLNEELKKKHESSEANRNLIQVGGSGSWMPSLKTMGSQMIKSVDATSFTEEDVGLDAMLEGFIKKIDSVDNFWDQIAYQSPGFLKFMNDHQDMNFMGNRIPVKPILNLLMIVLDSILLSVSLTPLKSTRFTKILNFVVFMEELLTGQWRQMLFTSIGFFSPSGIAFGVIAKYIVNAWMFVSPELRTQLFKDVLKGGKSALLGFLLWASVALPADAVRASTEESLAKIRETVEALDDKMEELQEEGSAALAPYGKKIEFSGIDLTNLRKISFQDIQNLQSLAQWDILVCSKEFQDIMVGIEGNPIFRFIIELLNIPTMDDDKAQKCKTLDFRPIKELVETALTPDVIDSVAKPPKDPFADYTGEAGLSKLKLKEEEEESKAEKEESQMGAEESRPLNEDPTKEENVNEDEGVKEVVPVVAANEDVPLVAANEDVPLVAANEEMRLKEEKLREEEEAEAEAEAEEKKRKLREEAEAEAEEKKRKHREEEEAEAEEKKRKLRENENQNPQNGGKRVLKLKKSTRYRKATPRRTTRRI